VGLAATDNTGALQRFIYTVTPGGQVCSCATPDESTMSALFTLDSTDIGGA
jgi:hypothetical protein